MHRKMNGMTHSRKQSSLLSTAIDVLISPVHMSVKNVHSYQNNLSNAVVDGSAVTLGLLGYTRKVHVSDREIS